MDCEDCRRSTIVALHDTGPWTHLPHVTQLCGLCCVQETPPQTVAVSFSLSCVVCAALKNPGHTSFAVTVSFSLSCVVCAALKKPRPKLVYCDSLLLNQLCGLCCLEEAPATLVYCGCVLLTQLCGQCCLEETPAHTSFAVSVSFTLSCVACAALKKLRPKLVYCDSLLPFIAMTMQFLLLPVPATFTSRDDLQSSPYPDLNTSLARKIV